MDIAIYGTNNCPNCVKVKQYLDTNNVKYEYQTIGVDITKDMVEEIVGEQIRSAPVILMNGKLSTFNDLKNTSYTITIKPDMLKNLEL